VEVLAALANAGFMLALVLGVAWNAVARLIQPQPVHGAAVIGVAAAGLAINIAVAWLLARGARDLNTHGALLHVMGDMLGSVAALAAGMVIELTGWMPIDPLLSLFISALILVSTLRLAREAVHTLLEGVPQELSLPEVGRRLASVPGVVSVHDLHIWSLSSRRPILTAHVVLKDLGQWDELLPEILTLLRREFHIEHATLQPEAYTPTFYAISDPDRPYGMA
jgi:cobalt-zinc-cadmium efflux system protein